MKKLIIMSAIGLATFAGLTSCSDFLDSDNKSTVTPEDKFGNKNGWNQLLNDAYYSMRAIYDDPQIFCTGTDMYTTSQGNAPSLLQTYGFTSEDASVLALYKNSYAAINAANCVLKYSSDAAINDEARFVRDYCYYILTQQFGSVPYITEYISTAKTSYPRTDLATVYTSVIEDLKEVINNGNLAQTPNPAEGRGHASILAAKALLAKVYLAAGWDLETTLTDAKTGAYTVNSTNYFSLAASTAAEVANTVPLTQPFATKWDFDVNESGNNTENLFAIQYDRSTSSNQVDGGNSMQHYFGGYMGANTDGVKALKNNLCPTERVYYAYDKGDDRYEGTFMTTIYGYDGNTDGWSKKGYWAVYNASDTELEKLPIAWKFFPWYTEDSEIETYCTSNASKFVTPGYKLGSKVFKVADQLVSKTYKKDGSFDAAASASNSLPFSAAIGKIGYLPPVKKFDDKNTKSGVKQSGGDYRDVIVLDASEIYLVAAEAYLMAGDETNSLKYLNAVRTRAHASVLNSFSDYKRYDWGLNDKGGYVSLGQTDSYEMTITKIDVILDERMRETVGECYRWMDLRRTKQLVRYNLAYNGILLSNMTGPDGEIKWLRPIPENEIQINSGISKDDQNPGYKSNGSSESDKAE